MNDRSFNNPVFPSATVPPLGGAMGVGHNGFGNNGNNGFNGLNGFNGFNSMNQPLPSETLDLVEYWRSISKRKWSIVGLGLVILAITARRVINLLNRDYL